MDIREVHDMLAIELAGVQEVARELIPYRLARNGGGL